MPGIGDPVATSWREMGREVRSAAYNNSAAVPSSAEQLARWKRLSATLRTSQPGALDLRYGPRPRNRIDLFPAENPDAPLLAFIHGGYWQRNAKEDFACMATGPLAQGVSVALIGYTLAPVASLSAIATEIRQALRFLRAGESATRWGGRLVVSGWSAGGHLAALAMQWPEADAGLAISGIYDLEPLQGTTIDNPLNLTAGEIEALSPQRLRPTGKPLILAYGGDELPELCRQSRDYAASAASGTAELLPIAGADHFSVLDGLIDPAGALTQAVARLAG